MIFFRNVLLHLCNCFVKFGFLYVLFSCFCFFFFFLIEADKLCDFVFLHLFLSLLSQSFFFFLKEKHTQVVLFFLLESHISRFDLGFHNLHLTVPSFIFLRQISDSVLNFLLEFNYCFKVFLIAFVFCVDNVFIHLH